MKFSRRHYLFLAILICFHLLYFVQQTIHHNYYLNDSHEYIAAAENIQNSFILYAGDTNEVLQPELFTKRTPVYPVIIAIGSLIAENPLFLLFLQMICSIISLFLVRQIAIDYGYSRKYDWLFLIILFFSPAQFIYTNMVMAEVILQLFLVLFLFHLLKFNKSGKIKNLICANIFLVIAFLTKPVMYLFIVPELLLLIYYVIKNKKPGILLVIFIPLFAIITYNFRNQKKTDLWHFSSIQTINLIDYNLYYFLMNTRGEDYARQKTDSIYVIAKVESFSDKVEILNHEASVIIRDNLISYGIFHIKGMLRFFLDPGRFDMSNFFGLEKKDSRGFLYYQNKYGSFTALKMIINEQHPGLLTAMLVISFFNIIKIILLFLFVFEKKIPLLVRIIVSILILYLAFVTGPLGASRFAMPLLPVIIAFGIAGLSGRYDFTIAITTQREIEISR